MGAGIYYQVDTWPGGCAICLPDWLPYRFFWPREIAETPAAPVKHSRKGGRKRKTGRKQGAK